MAGLKKGERDGVELARARNAVNFGEPINLVNPRNARVFRTIVIIDFVALTTFVVVVVVAAVTYQSRERGVLVNKAMRNVRNMDGFITDNV